MILLARNLNDRAKLVMFFDFAFGHRRSLFHSIYENCETNTNVNDCVQVLKGSNDNVQKEYLITCLFLQSTE